MSYESRARNKAGEEMQRLECLVAKGTATKYQKLTLKRLYEEYGQLVSRTDFVNKAIKDSKMKENDFGL